ncbi:uncharacterized protein LOC126965938 [Leptidea sinapis]|uniref:uncharacterized protein LOC126965938 n=1 Tax=Leptidea sinapis TaxID=189913 RepID=UPI0021381615|nr:uncharacterized protein LOC126965938 [Leptidea sinapis]
MDSGKVEAMPPGLAHLDTVRSLHQTVVSLRTALEVSKNELKELKEKYLEHSRCLQHADIIEKLSIENHILRRKIIESCVESQPDHLLEVPLSVEKGDSDICSDIVIETATTNNDKARAFESDFRSDTEYNNNIVAADIDEGNSQNILTEIIEDNFSESSQENESIDSVKTEAHEDKYQIGDKESWFSQENRLEKLNFKKKLELLSKFDVKIKVRTLKENSAISSTTDTESSEDRQDKKQNTESQTTKTREFEFKEKKHHFETFNRQKGHTIDLKQTSSENIKMAVPSSDEAEIKSKVDKFDVQVKITSEDSLVVRETIERARQKATFNLDVDELSFRSMSEGDNSVFSEANTPLEPNINIGDKQEENASGNESEEVDDIELIFTTDESKDMSNLQEDLVSIKETEAWTPSSTTTHSTPVLIKFHTLDPDYQSDHTDPAPIRSTEHIDHINDPALKVKRVSLPNDNEIERGAKGNLDIPGRGILKSFSNKSDNMLYRRSHDSRRMDSVDSLSYDCKRGLSFDTKSSSYELGSSMDILNRDPSMDNFNRCRLSHRFSVFPESDMSKCGVSEEDLLTNLNTRRNTCPNPFQYRPPPRVGLLNKPVSSAVRPILREFCGARREGSAQTDMSALPPRWTSDGYLAYKMSVPGGRGTVTLPQRASPVRASPQVRRPPAPEPLHRHEAKRALLSDIGFTSMVPELSRSAEPLWTLWKSQHPTETSPKHRYTRSSYRSPSVSVDRSNDWTHSYLATRGSGSASGWRGWRGSLPDVRADDTDSLLHEADMFVRRSTDNLLDAYTELDTPLSRSGQPYIPAEARQLRLGHAVKLITPQGRLAVGRVRYVGIAGGSAAQSGIVVGAEFSTTEYPGLPLNDGTYRGRRYFLTPPHYTAVFVPFSKVVMAWAT